MTGDNAAKVGWLTAAEAVSGGAGRHVLTYAEEGFSPLSLHGVARGLNQDTIAHFADQVNVLNEAGSLFPVAAISAIPRTCVRDSHDPRPAQRHIARFLAVNRDTIRAKALLFDFRTHELPGHIARAIELALAEADLAGIEEVMVVR